MSKTLDVFSRDVLATTAPNGRWREWLFVPLALRYYLDESESSSADDPAVCVAGYIGEGKKWMQFINPWNRVLDSAPKHVEVFHGTDYDYGRKSKWGSFNGWTVEERDAFINNLAKVLRAYKLRNLGCVIHRSTFKQAAGGKRSGKHGDLFVVAAKVAMVNATRWCAWHGYPYAPSFIVEQGSKYAAEMKEALHDLKESDYPRIREFFKLSAVSEVPKSREYPQTQPADCLAFYCSKWAARFSGFDPHIEPFENFQSRTGAEMPSELQVLLKHNNNVTYHTAGTLDSFFATIEAGMPLNQIGSIADDAG